MDLHRRKLWGDRLTWLFVLAATAVIVSQYIQRRGQFQLYLLLGWSFIVFWLLFVSELRLGRRRPSTGARDLFAGWAAFVGEEQVSNGNRERTASAATPGTLVFEAQGCRWTARTPTNNGVNDVLIGWRDLFAWRINGVLPMLWRASGYLTLSTHDGREAVFHIHGLRRWRSALSEAAIVGPTFLRPDWLPDEGGAELPMSMADLVDREAKPASIVSTVGPLVSPQMVAPEEKPEPARIEQPAATIEQVVQSDAPADHTPEPTLQQVPEPEVEELEVEQEVEVEQSEVEYEAVIGLECHVELSTASKVFCGCPTTFGAEPNTHICPVCTGQPGTLPVLNEKAVEFAIKIGLALDCRIAPESIFHRKNYFYPDMPKNYQISQYDVPLCSGGRLAVDVDGEPTTVGVHRVHLEEDTGKISHAGGSGRIGDADYAKIDYNRAGVPLVEIVTEPDITSPEQARAYVTELRAVLETLGVSDVRMDEGSLRCDANVSIRPVGDTNLGTKTEVKNMNSIRSVQRALAFEIERQKELVASGGRVVQETRHFDENTGRTLGGRVKEGSDDYRYFPDPDLVTLAPAPDWIQQIGSQLPELPTDRRRRLVEAHSLSEADARAITSSKGLADAFEQAVGAYGGEAKSMARWYLGELAAMANDRNVEPHEVGISPMTVVELQRLVDTGEISISAAKGQVLREVVATGKSAREVVGDLGLAQISGTDELSGIVDEVIADNANLADQVRGGKMGAINALVGQVMKRTSGRANPEVVRDLLSNQLGVTSE